MIGIPWDIFAYLVMGFIMLALIIAACFFYTFNMGYNVGYKDGYKARKIEMEDHNDR
jgi:hypothetical protein